MMATLQLMYKEGLYIAIKYNPSTVSYLSMFLTDDVGRNRDEYAKRFESPEDTCGAMNATQFTKEEGMVWISPEWVDEDENLEKGNYFQIRADLLAKLLREWDTVLKTKPQFITIITDDDFVSVTGSRMRSEG